jgi:hypothetical protein
VKSRALLALLLIAACSRPVPKQTSKPRQPGKIIDTVNEQTNVLDITRGATIVSRTGEVALVASAINTIDGDAGSFWAPPPHDYPQSIVIALGARSRVDRVGIRSMTIGGYQAGHVTFERSLDGAVWQPLTTLTSRVVSEAQWTDVAPSEAAYLRVTIPDAKNSERDAHLQSLFAHGAEIVDRRNPPIDGCWTINGVTAAFAQRGARATGVVAQRIPVSLFGGTDGRMWRFNWIRGNDYGYTVLTVSPDGKTLSALNWHEEAIPLFSALPWFGEHTACAALKQRDDVPVAILRRAGHVSMFALQFAAGGQLLAEASREELQTLANIVRTAPVVLRIVAHEFRQPNAKHNKEIAQREIASLREALTQLGYDNARVEWVAAGSDAPRQTPETNAARAIYSSVEVEVRR